MARGAKKSKAESAAKPSSALRALPALDECLRAAQSSPRFAGLSRSYVKAMMLRALAARRDAIAQGDCGAQGPRDAMLAGNRARRRARGRDRRAGAQDRGERNRRRAPHQPGPRAAARARHRGRRAGRAFRGQSRIRSRGRRTRRSRFDCRKGNLRADRRRGRDGGQQQRRRGVARTHRARRGTRGDRIARRVDRDRRVVPAAGRDGAKRRAAARSRHHQPHAPARLRSRDRPPNGASCSRSTRPTTGWSVSRTRSRCRSW